MNDTPYSKREIDSQHDEVIKYLVRIEAQTVKTNGRVNSLEKWRSYIVGAVAIITFAVIPLILYIYQHSNLIK